MAKIRVTEATNNEIALVINDKVLSTWRCPLPETPFLRELTMVQYMLREAYEQGKRDQKEETGKTLRDIFGLKE